MKGRFRLRRRCKPKRKKECCCPEKIVILVFADKAVCLGRRCSGRERLKRLLLFRRCRRLGLA